MQLNSSVAIRSAARGLILGAIWVSAAGAFSGCGQKGPLTLPGAATAAAPAASAAATASAPGR
jgi:predicted small lipoprotein YifL